MRNLKAYKIFESTLKSEVPRDPYRFGKEIFPNKHWKGKAYHLTPDINLDEIKRVGLKAKTENKLENHPERIYLFLNPDIKAYKYYSGPEKSCQNCTKPYKKTRTHLKFIAGHFNFCFFHLKILQKTINLR